MSVGVKETKKSSGFRAEWDNICRLYRLQIVQKQLVPLCLLLFAVGCIVTISLSGQVSLIRSPGDLDYIRGTGGTVWIYILIFMLGVCILDYNILSSESMSIYPGTVRTRFISRLLLDYTMFFVIMAFSVISRLLGVGITQLIITVTGNTGMAVFFDFKSLLLRAAACLCYMLMFHGIYILSFTISTKIGVKNTVIFPVVLGVIAGLMLKFTPLLKWMLRIVKFYVYEEMGFANVVVRTLLTTVILLAISFVVMMTIHVWKDRNPKELLVFSVFFAYMVLFLVTTVGSFIVVRRSVSGSTDFPEEGLEEMLANHEFISHDSRIHAGEADGEKLIDSWMGGEEDVTTVDEGNAHIVWISLANIAWMDLDKARERGMVADDTTLGEGEMLVRVVASSYKEYGEEVYQRFIDGVNFSIVDSKCVLDIEKNMVLYDEFLSVFNPILGMDVEGVDASVGNSSTIEKCQIYVIFNKGDVKQYNKLESYYGDY